ncbi:hypothetical protein NCCP1664_22790 [Zafaria cholistanensis]|uniref:Uncharacterized protein n=1 Tax=Zafaria cholistanensis TaxID=1682741 RepID=A0A5A7NSB9_9MICC|nr:hypothetical protein NCCP1664_22790 [Zafaria cholistanensis]
MASPLPAREAFGPEMRVQARAGTHSVQVRTPFKNALGPARLPAAAQPPPSPRQAPPKKEPQ